MGVIVGIIFAKENYYTYKEKKKKKYWLFKK